MVLQGMHCDDAEPITRIYRVNARINAPRHYTPEAFHPANCFGCSSKLSILKRAEDLATLYAVHQGRHWELFDSLAGECCPQTDQLWLAEVVAWGTYVDDLVGCSAVKHRLGCQRSCIF